MYLSTVLSAVLKRKLIITEPYYHHYLNTNQGLGMSENHSPALSVT